MKSVFYVAGRRAGVWLALIVMAAMALGGCKGEDRGTANVKDKDFEKVGYLLGTKENPVGAMLSEYYYVVKNNSKETVAIEGTAKAYCTDGKELEELTNEIPVLGPGETSVMTFIYNVHAAQIDHVDCKLKYNKTDLLPVIGNIDTEVNKVDNYVAVFATNMGEVDAEYLGGLVLFFDADNNVIASNSQLFYDAYVTGYDTLKPMTTQAAMFTPTSDYMTMMFHFDADKLVEYDHVKMYLTYLQGSPATYEGAQYVQKKTKPPVGLIDRVIEEKLIEYKDPDGCNHYYLAVKNISDQRIAVRGGVTLYGDLGRRLASRTMELKGLNPGESGLLIFDFKFFDSGIYASESLKNPNYISHSLAYYPEPEEMSHASEFELDAHPRDGSFMKVYATYNGDEDIDIPGMIGLFYDAYGKVVFVGEGWCDPGHKENKGVDLTGEVKLKKGNTIVYEFERSYMVTPNNISGDQGPIPEYDSYELYMIELWH